MELVEENQKVPLVSAIVLTVMVVLTSEVLTHFSATSVAQANQLYWLLDRSAGVTAYELLALSSILGLSMTMGAWDKRGLRKWAKQLHQYVTLLVLPFLGLHLFGLLQDSSVPFSLRQLLIPFASTYRPFWTALGTLSLYAVLVLIVSSYIRDRISVKVWRAIHYTSFPMFLAVTIHGFTIGTDSRTLAGHLMYAIPLCIVVVLTLIRMNKSR